jgi:hypothetical protein
MLCDIDAHFHFSSLWCFTWNSKGHSHWDTGHGSLIPSGMRDIQHKATLNQRANSEKIEHATIVKWLLNHWLTGITFVITDKKLILREIVGKKLIVGRV